MVEKPTAEQAPSNVAVIGRYILTPDIFDILRDVAPDDGGEIQLTDALKVQASEGRVLAYEFDGIRFDCGQVPGFVQATQYVFEHYYGQH
jgi:UTP--glucose-1-phosphate uridylyltransferase